MIQFAAVQFAIAPSIVLPIITFFIVMWLNKTDSSMLHFNLAEFLATMVLMIIPVINLLVFAAWIYLIVDVRYSDKISVWFSKKPFCGE